VGEGREPLPLEALVSLHTDQPHSRRTTRPLRTPSTSFPPSTATAPTPPTPAGADTGAARARVPRPPPYISGQTGAEPIFQGAADFDLELVGSRTLDGHIQELIYRPTLH
jgi:hypothetical protein